MSYLVFGGVDLKSSLAVLMLGLAKHNLTDDSSIMKVSSHLTLRKEAHWLFKGLWVFGFSAHCFVYLRLRAPTVSTLFQS